MSTLDGGIFYSFSNMLQLLNGTSTSNQMLMSGSFSAPSWSTATYPSTTTINQILYSNANNVVSEITANTSLTLKLLTQVGTGSASTAPVWSDPATLGITPKAYQGSTLRANAFPVFQSVTVSSGVAVFNLTVDGTSGGSPIFPNSIIIESVNVIVNDSAASYQMSWALSNSNKTITVTAFKYTTASLLTGILGQVAANGASVRLSAWGY